MNTNNNNIPRPIELLAPAKNLEQGIMAIDHGADAVYIGANEFGARQAAGNSIEDIAQLAAYAHQFGARVYVTFGPSVFAVPGLYLVTASAFLFAAIAPKEESL